MASLTTLAIRWCKWWFTGIIGVNDANGTNNSSGAIHFNVQWHVWNVDDTSPFNGANNTTGANEAIGSSVANGIIFTIGTIVANGAIVKLPPLYDQCIIIFSNKSSLLQLGPMLPLSPLVTIGAINFHWTF